MVYIRLEDMLKLTKTVVLTNRSYRRLKPTIQNVSHICVSFGIYFTLNSSL